MTIRSGGLVLLGIAITASTICGQKTKNEQGQLTVNLTTTFGSAVSRGILSIKSDQARLVYSSEAQGQVVVHLPYGTYTIAFEADWYQPCRRQVVIDSPVAFIELAALFIAPEENYHRGSISVKVDRGTSCNPEGALWAKLVGVYVHDVMEQAISSGGYALFESVDRGAYIVIVADGSKIRAMSPIVTTGEITIVNLVLSSCESK